MTAPIRCLFCKDTPCPVELPVCARCRAAAADSSSIDRVLHDLQQYRLVVPRRFSGSKRFVEELRTAARAAGFQPVEGPAAVEVTGQRTLYDGGPWGAYRFVEKVLGSLAWGPHTEVRAIRVSLVEDGKPWTQVAVRGLLKDELYGIGGVTR